MFLAFIRFRSNLASSDAAALAAFVLFHKVVGKTTSAGSDRVTNMHNLVELTKA